MALVNLLSVSPEPHSFDVQLYKRLKIYEIHIEFSD